MTRRALAAALILLTAVLCDALSRLSWDRLDALTLPELVFGGCVVLGTGKALGAVRRGRETA